MPHLATELATAAARKESLVGVPRSYGPPPQKPGLSERELAHRVIGEGEIVSELEATQRLAKFGVVTMPNVMVNGTTEPISRQISKGFWQWEDWKAGTLRRAKPTPRPLVRSVFRPRISSEPRFVRELRSEVHQLRAAVAGLEERLPIVPVGAGKALLRNPHRWGFAKTPVGPLEPLEIVECEADLCDAAVRSGVFVRISAQECARLIAASG